jgi:hypothetical protein
MCPQLQFDMPHRSGESTKSNSNCTVASISCMIHIPTKLLFQQFY